MDTVPRLGQLVYSKAGRDSGRAMVVVGVADGRHVLVADGDGHPTARPKRKNIRHLAAAAPILAEVAAGHAVSDEAVRAWLLDVARSEGEGA